MRLGCEIKLRKRAPAAHFDVLLRGTPDGHAGVRQIGNASQQLAKARLQFLGGFLPLLDCLAQRLGLADQVSCVLPGFLAFCNFFGRGIPLCLQGLSFGDGVAALRVNLMKILEDLPRIHTPLAELLLD